MDVQGGDNRPSMEFGSQGSIATVERTDERQLVRSSTPAVYVPRRFRIGGIDGVPTGAAIVGTPQGDGMVAIDVVSTAYVEPTPERWSTWIGEACRRHECTDREELQEGEEFETRLVSEAALVEVGECMQGHARIDDPAKGAQLSRWLQAGRADFVAERPFPHEA